MPYSNTVTLLSIEGGTFPQVTARLWMLWTVVGTGTGSGPRQSEQESVTLQSSGTFTLSFNLGPSNSAVSRGIGLSLQDPNQVSSDAGWWFRSGRFEDALSTEPIEIVLAAPQEILASDLPSLLPSPPFSVDADTDVTEFTATLAQGGIDFTATGTTRKTGVVVGFRYTGRLVLSPSPDVAAAELEAFSVGILNPAIVFLPGPSVLSAVEAELMNLTRLFIMREIGPQIRTGLERRVNAAVLSSVGRTLPGGALPAGVVLSVRTVDINANRIQIRAALGAFGGVFSKFPKVTSNPRCFIATAVHGADSREVVILRAFRDRSLSKSPIGRQLVMLYERLSPGIAAFISRRPFLKSVTRALVVTPAVWVARRSLTSRSSRRPTKRGAA